MKLIQVHINEVKKTFRRIRYFESKKQHYIAQIRESDIIPITEKEYLEFILNDVDQNRIIAAYFVTNYFFYYLERMNEYYLLTKFWGDSYQRIILPNDVVQSIEEKISSFDNFKEFCIDIDQVKCYLGV